MLKLSIFIISGLIAVQGTGDMLNIVSLLVCAVLFGFWLLQLFGFMQTVNDPFNTNKDVIKSLTIKKDKSGKGKAGVQSHFYPGMLTDPKYKGKLPQSAGLNKSSAKATKNISSSASNEYDDFGDFDFSANQNIPGDEELFNSFNHVPIPESTRKHPKNANKVPKSS